MPKPSDIQKVSESGAAPDPAASAEPSQPVVSPSRGSAGLGRRTVGAAGGGGGIPAGRCKAPGRVKEVGG